MSEKAKENGKQQIGGKQRKIWKEEEKKRQKFWSQLRKKKEEKKKIGAVDRGAGKK